MPKYLGVCDGCGLAHLVRANDMAEATTTMEKTHKQQRPECHQPKLVVVETTMVEDTPVRG